MPVYIGVAAKFLEENPIELLQWEQALRAGLPHTPVFIVDLAEQENVSLWCQIVEPLGGAKALDGQFAWADLPALPAQIQELKQNTIWRFTVSRFCEFWRKFGSKSSAALDPAAAQVAILAEQLVAVEELNQKLQTQPSGWLSLKTPPPQQAGNGNYAIWDCVGGAADSLANQYQQGWQRLLFEETKAIDPEAKRSLARLFLHPSLFVLGVLSALGLAGFSELSDGCSKEDIFVWMGCSTGLWKAWFGTACFGLYFSALIWAWLRYAGAKVNKLEGRHYDYRLLAEMLRLRYVAQAANYALRPEGELAPKGMQRTASNWVWQVLRAIPGLDVRQQDPDADTEKNLWLLTNFISPQEQYHANILIKRRKRALERINKLASLGFAVFSACFVLLSVQVVLRTFGHEDSGFLSPMGQHLVLISQVFGLAIWGGMRKISGVFAYEQEIQRGLDVLEKLEDAKGGDPIKMQLALEKFMQDQIDWHALHSERPIEATVGG